MGGSTIRAMLGSIRLTELTTCGGCAAKLGADALAEALAGLGIDDAHGDRGHDHPSAADASSGLIAGLNPPDDAAVYLVAPGVAVIGTLDFFPPIVDDPRTFGEIAAANALSDVFAMGGKRSWRAPHRRSARPAASSRAGTRSATLNRSTGSR